MENNDAIVSLDKFHNDTGMGWKHYRRIKTTDQKIDEVLIRVLNERKNLDEKNATYCYTLTKSDGTSAGRIFTVDNNLFD